jgi:hypothetical protein
VTLRIAAAVALVVGIAALFADLHLRGDGPFAAPEARHRRAMQDRSGSPTVIANVTFAELAALPRRLPVAEASGFERRAVRLEGYVQRMERRPDGDLTLEIAPVRGEPGAPAAACVIAGIAPAWRRGSQTWRYDALLATFRPGRGGVTAWDGGPVRVRLSGWLLDDAAADDPGAAPRLTGWAIDPVTRIEVWDDARAAFAEAPR